MSWWFDARDTASRYLSREDTIEILFTFTLLGNVSLIILANENKEKHGHIWNCKKNSPSRQSNHDHKEPCKKEINSWENERIRRPPNAFMIFAKDHRRRIASENPQVANKSVSTILGNMWKQLNTSAKAEYYDRAKLVESEHKKQYPGYRYNPKEARQLKELKARNKCLSRKSAGKAENKSSLSDENCFGTNKKICSLREVYITQAVANINKELRKEAIQEQVLKSMGLTEAICNQKGCYMNRWEDTTAELKMHDFVQGNEQWILESAITMNSTAYDSNNFTDDDAYELPEQYSGYENHTVVKQDFCYATPCESFINYFYVNEADDQLYEC